MMFDDLVGIPYAQADCYDLVRRGLERLGWQVPADRAEAVRAQRWMGWRLGPGQAAEVGDVVVMHGGGGQDGLHVGLVVDGPRELVLHAMGQGLSSVVVPLGMLRRSGTVRYVLRLRRGGTATDRVDGAEVVEAGDPVSIVLAVVGVAAAAASSLMARNIRSPEPAAPESPNRRYAFNRLASEAVAGDPIPVVFGRHVRLGGKVVAALPGEGPEGDTILRMLICYGHGEIESIGGLRETAWTAAADVPALASGGIYVADQPIGGLVGARVAVRVGTANQPVIPGFADAEVLRTVGSDGSLLANTSGAERTGSSPSAEAVTFSTLDAVNAAVLRVAFRRGLYTLGAQGGTQARTARWRWRWRTSDVGAGAGAWSAWTVQSVTRAEQAGFTTSVRLDRAGVPAVRLDVQAERVSVTPTTVDRVDEMTFDSVVEVRYGQLTYPGMALLAVELRASEQVNSVPEVSATVLGLRVRVWDGVSPASAPVLVRQYSANPAYAALELLTNATWGMGSIYRDEAIDLHGLVDWAQHCAESVAVPVEFGGGGGVTRPRLALSLWMSDRRDGVEWLRVIGRAGRCEPSLAGRRWRFVVDKVRPGIVERFGDGDIAMRDGRPLLTWRRDLARNGALGASRANRLTARFANEQADGRADVQSFPEFGDGWLGPPESEAVREESLSLEGVSHPHQVAAELRLALRKIRTLTRTVVFTTSKAVVAVTPGDVFALSAGLVNWGFASGRVLPGSTTTAVVLDRDVTVAAGERRFVEIRHVDNSVEVAEISVPTPTGELGGSGVVLPAGTAVGLVAALTQAPEYGAGYAIGRPGATVADSPTVPASKPFVCQRVTPTIDDAGGLVWEIEGLEYDAAVYNEAGQRWTRVRDYAAPLAAGVMPGAVATLTAAANLLAGAGDDGAVDVAWTQTPADAAATTGFRVFYRVTGTAGQGNGGWVLLADQGQSGGAGLGRRGGLVRLGLASGTAVEFVVVAVGSDGRALAAEDERHPRASVVIGQPDDRPAAVTGLTIVALRDGRHRLTWTPPTAGPQPSGYRLDLLGQVDSPTPSSLDLADCVPLAVVSETEATFYVPWCDGPERRVWVRGMGPSGRMGPAASLVLPNAVAAPPGWTTEWMELEPDLSGTLDGLVTDGTVGNAGGLRLDTGETQGTWTSGVISLATGGPKRVRVDPQVLNLAADPEVAGFDLPMTGAAADQWGVVSGGGTSSPVIGMVGPPEPTTVWGVGIELRWRETGTGLWTPWVAVQPGGETDVVADALRVRVTLRASADGVYRPGLGRQVFVVAYSENA